MRNYCEKCNGRGRVFMHGLEDAKCDHCNGTGTLNYDVSSLYPNIDKGWKVANRNDLELKALSFAIHAINRRNGFYDEPVSRPQFIALAHSELSEALEADRKRNEENYREELADTVIRLLDRCAYENIDIAYEIGKKLNTNKNRGYKHGNKKY